jgi:hypothetical protein
MRDYRPIKKDCDLWSYLIIKSVKVGHCRDHGLCAIFARSSLSIFYTAEVWLKPKMEWSALLVPNQEIQTSELKRDIT